MLTRVPGSSLFVLKLLAAVCLLASFASADSKARIVRVSHLEGDVQMDRRDGRGFGEAFLNMPVVERSRLWAREDGRAEVEFENGGTLRLTPNTLVEFSQLALRSTGGKLTFNDVQEGTAYFNLKREQDDDDLRVMVGGQELAVSKSSRFRLRSLKDRYEVAVFKGSLDVQRHRGERVEVRKGETLAVNIDDDRYFLSRDVAELAFDDWDRDREKEIERRASNYRQGYRDGYYAASWDLHRYGRFVDVPGYGVVWQPIAIYAGWHPYSDGAWVYYPGYGYVWVSAHPWGWAPYRSGVWVHIGGRGWCWRPGTVNHVTVVNIVNPPSGYVKPAPPATPATVTAGVVPVGAGPVTGKTADDVILRRTGRPGRDGDPSDGSAAPVISTSTKSAGTVASEPPARTARGGRDGDAVEAPTKGMVVDAEDDGFSRTGRGRRDLPANNSPQGTRPAVTTDSSDRVAPRGKTYEGDPGNQRARELSDDSQHSGRSHQRIDRTQRIESPAVVQPAPQVVQPEPRRIDPPPTRTIEPRESREPRDVPRRIDTAPSRPSSPPPSPSPRMSPSYPSGGGVAAPSPRMSAPAPAVDAPPSKRSQ